MFCLRPCCWTAPELGVGFLRVLRCPELFFECKKGCRPGFCTRPRHCIHPALSHCSGPKNLGNQKRERENDKLVYNSRQVLPGDGERTRGTEPPSDYWWGGRVTVIPFTPLSPKRLLPSVLTDQFCPCFLYLFIVC